MCELIRKHSGWGSPGNSDSGFCSYFCVFEKAGRNDVLGFTEFGFRIYVSAVSSAFCVCTHPDPST